MTWDAVSAVPTDSASVPDPSVLHWKRVGLFPVATSAIALTLVRSVMLAASVTVCTRI